MILPCIIAWVLLTACGEYLLHEASFMDGWRERRVKAGGWWGKMISCFACPWGWASVPAGLVVGIGSLAHWLQPWAVVPLVAVCLPAFGLGLARLVALLSPLAAMQKGGE